MESARFREFLKQVEPIRMREPLAQTLGAFQEDNTVLEYSFTDAIKLAGHACPTVTGAFLVCQYALQALYSSQHPIRGEIAITVYGEPDEGVYGVIGQVLGFITGAAPNSGFRGLGPKFRRKDLLQYTNKKPDSEALSFEFRRMDSGRAVLVKYFPQRVPASAQDGARMGELLERVLWDAARPEELTEFQNLWMDKVKTMIIDKKDIDQWLQVEERNGA